MDLMKTKLAVVAGLVLALTGCNLPTYTIMCAYEGMPSAMMHEVKSHRRDPATIAGTTAQGREFIYHLREGEVCYIVQENLP